MAEPVSTAAAIASIVKLLAPLFIKGNNVDVDLEHQKLIDTFTKLLEPAISAQARAAQVSGNTIAQNLATSVGRAGTGRTGVGAAVRNVANTVGGTRAIDARGRGAANIATLANQALPGVLDAKLKNELTPTRFEALIAGLGQAQAATGEDPLAAVLGGFLDLFKRDDKGGSSGRNTPSRAPTPSVQRPAGGAGGLPRA
jgi:hypothetical protein